MSNQPSAQTRILVVDDDRDICENVRDILEDLGYLVDIALEGESAMRFVQEKRYDIALLDYMMPGMNGVELYQKIRRVQPDLIAIMITAFAGGDGAQLARDAGTWRVLSKPIDPTVLLPMIDQASQWPIVLVVDDDDAFCENLWQTLRSHDYRVDIARTEAEGVEKAQRPFYQTAIIDLRLDQGDGRHVIEMVRRVRPEAKLLIVTGSHESDESLPDCVEGICYKPVNMDELLGMLE